MSAESVRTPPLLVSLNVELDQDEAIFTVVATVPPQVIQRFLDGAAPHGWIVTPSSDRLPSNGRVVSDLDGRRCKLQYYFAIGTSDDWRGFRVDGGADMQLTIPLSGAETIA